MSQNTQPDIERDELISSAKNYFRKKNPTPPFIAGKSYIPVTVKSVD